MADVNRKVVEAAYQDAEVMSAAIDKLAGAQSITEAYEVYVDYLRQQGNVVGTRAKSAASFVSAKASEDFGALRDGITKVMPARSQAA